LIGLTGRIPGDLIGAEIKQQLRVILTVFRMLQSSKASRGCQPIVKRGIVHLEALSPRLKKKECGKVLTVYSALLAEVLRLHSNKNRLRVRNKVQVQAN
jgi:hypothetical protein